MHAPGRAQLFRTPIDRTRVAIDLTRGVTAAAFSGQKASRSTSGRRAVVASSRRPARRSVPTRLTA